MHNACDHARGASTRATNVNAEWQLIFLSLSFSLSVCRERCHLVCTWSRARCPPILFFR